jgi:hypothetical protein
MSTYADKSQENKQQSVANAAPQKQSCGESTFQFVDNRPKVIAQRKSQEMANNSPQVSRLRAFQDMANNSPQAEQTAQLQSMADNHSMLYASPLRQKDRQLRVMTNRLVVQRQPQTVKIEGQEENGDPASGAKEAVDDAITKAASEVQEAMGSSEGEKEMMEYAEPGMDDAAPEEKESIDSDSDSATEEKPSEDSPLVETDKLEAEIEAELKTELDEKYPAEGEKEPAADKPVQRIHGVVQLYGPIRRNRGRAARARAAPERVQPQRQSRGPAVPNPAAIAYWAHQRQQRIAHALRMGAYRRVLQHTIAAYLNYPPGSYGHGRWLYLTGRLRDLGADRRALLNFDEASIEVDHSPHDASQRAGARIDDEASRHRVAVPLPRAWHRRHQTTHGPSASRYSAAFSDNQAELVAEGNYAQALKNHLLDTFSNGAIGETGHKKITIVAQYARNAVDYAQRNIPVSIFRTHQAGTPAITAAEHAAILVALHTRIEEIKTQPGKGGIMNPF